MAGEGSAPARVRKGRRMEAEGRSRPGKRGQRRRASARSRGVALRRRKVNGIITASGEFQFLGYLLLILITILISFVPLAIKIGFDRAHDTAGL